MAQSLRDSAAATTSGTGDLILVGDAVNGAVGVALTALTCSTGAATFTAWVQGSFDGGSTWFDMPAVARCVTSGGAADVAGALTKRNIIDTVTDTSTALSYYNWMPEGIRVKWVLAGTDASATFAAWFHGR